MSHELRTPLNAIAGYVQLIEMGVHGPVTEAQREALGRVQKSELHLLSLVNDVLNFAKIEAGRVEYDVRDVVLAEVIEDVGSMIEPQCTARGIACEISVPSVAVVRADRDKLAQILITCSRTR